MVGVGVPGVVRSTVRELFLSGRGPARLGQPRVVACVTGGGGSFWSYLLSEPGASSCLLEGLVPYDKASLLSFLEGSGRTPDGVGFSSAEMALLLAEAARDRALQLTPVLSKWPDCVGVACTATIVSHYTRRGEYRAHAAAVDAGGISSTYVHKLLKGARERPEEDAAVGLLALRALADATARPSAAELASSGILTDPDAVAGRSNAVGEIVGEGAVEVVPERIPMDPSRFVSLARVLVPIPGKQSASTVVAPVALPQNTLVVLLPCNTADQAEDTASKIVTVLEELDLEGDGREDKGWGVPQAPVIFDGGEHPKSTIDVLSGLLSREGASITNWGVVDLGQLTDADDDSTSLERMLLQFPGATFVLPPAVGLSIVEMAVVSGALAELAIMAVRGCRFVCVGDGALHGARRSVDELPPSVAAMFTWLEHANQSGSGKDHVTQAPSVPLTIDVDVRMIGLDDGSPSTIGIDGQYAGDCSPHSGLPHGRGRMQWDNGITYEGEWRDGKYHGHGTKLYSKGGGYSGHWDNGQRSGRGISMYDGKFGYDRWEGWFENDVPHGAGVMYVAVDAHDGSASTAPGSSIEGVAFEFAHGTPVTRNETQAQS